MNTVCVDTNEAIVKELQSKLDEPWKPLALFDDDGKKGLNWNIYQEGFGILGDLEYKSFLSKLQPATKDEPKPDVSKRSITSEDAEASSRLAKSDTPADTEDAPTSSTIPTDDGGDVKLPDNQDTTTSSTIPTADDGDVKVLAVVKVPRGEGQPDIDIEELEC